jgi:cytochrome c-type biogenesis protein
MAISEIAEESRSLWARGGKTGQFLFALAVGAGLALISWWAGILDTNVFGGVSDSAVSAGGPGSLVAIGAAFVIGAVMIVLPCGFPSVFVVPSILGSRKGLSQRGVLSGLFLLGSALPLAAVGVGLGFAGEGVLNLLEPMSAKMSLAVGLYSALGLLAIAYALSELGVFSLPSLTARMTGPNLPDHDRPYRRALVLGGTFGGGLGIGCPMPTYYILLGWAAAAANPLYGAILLGVYGLGRVVPAVALGALITAGTDRRKVSQGMTSFRERTSGLTNGILGGMGSYLIVLFGGVVLYRTLTL